MSLQRTMRQECLCFIVLFLVPITVPGIEDTLCIFVPKWMNNFIGGVW